MSLYLSMDSDRHNSVILHVSKPCFIKRHGQFSNTYEQFVDWHGSQVLAMRMNLHPGECIEVEIVRADT